MVGGPATIFGNGAHTVEHDYNSGGDCFWKKDFSGPDIILMYDSAATRWKAKLIYDSALRLEWQSPPSADQCDPTGYSYTLTTNNTGNSGNDSATCSVS